MMLAAALDGAYSVRGTATATAMGTNPQTLFPHQLPTPFTIWRVNLCTQRSAGAGVRTSPPMHLEVSRGMAVESKGEDSQLGLVLEVAGLSE